MKITSKITLKLKNRSFEEPEKYSCVASPKYIHHVDSNGKTTIAVNLLIRAYYRAQNSLSETDKEDIIDHIRDHIEMIRKKCGKKKYKQIMKKAAIYEKKRAKTNTYKLFLEYISIFGEL